MYRCGISKRQLIKNVLDCCSSHGINVTKTFLRKKKPDTLLRAWRSLQRYSRAEFFRLIGLDDPKKPVSRQISLFN